MKKKNTTTIGMAVCFLMMTSFAWAIDIPGVPNGTVTNGNLVWLQNANCFGAQTRDTAIILVENLKSGSCGLTDGSTARQWRLPTKEELQARQRNHNGFNNVVQSYYYWSSSAYVDGWYVVLTGGYLSVGYKYKGDAFYIWPVRSKQ